MGKFQRFLTQINNIFVIYIMDFALDGWVIEILEHFGNLMDYLKDCEN